MHTMTEIGAVVDLFRENKCSLNYFIRKYLSNEKQDANLNMINTLKKKFGCNVYYSGHENGRAVTCAAAV